MAIEKSRALVLALALVVFGLLAGLALTSAVHRPEDRDWEAEMEALDARIAALPPAQQNFVLVSHRVVPAVVTVSTEQVITRHGMRFNIPERFRRFFEFNEDFPGSSEDMEQRVRNLGSGVIVDPAGIIITNNHVVAQADHIQVTLADRRKLDAEVIGTDPESDIAVIRIDADNLPFLQLGDSDAIEVGQWVLAVGNPLSESFRQSVTAGIVSAKGRSVGGGLATFEDFIQTDAAINRGNSGGALVDLEGKLIGINTAIISQNGQFNGVGLAIPANLVQRVMDSLLEHGRVLRGWIGVQLQPMSDTMASALGLDRPIGALVAAVLEDTPGSRAGIRRGDLILSVNEYDVESDRDLINYVGRLNPGTEVTLRIRRDQQELRLSLTLGERPEQQQEAEEQAEPSAGGETILARIGLEVTALTDSLARRLGFEDQEGVLVSRVRSGGPAYTAGLRSGMLIQEVDRSPVSSVNQLSAALESAEAGDAILLYVRLQGGGGSAYVAIQVPE